MIKRKEAVLKDDNCKHAELINASTDILLISIVSKRPNSRSQNVPTISKRTNYLKTAQLSQNVQTSKTAQLSQNVPTISKCPDYLM